MDSINEAVLGREEIIEHADCEECREDYLFLMRDAEHEFFVGLRTILSCLAFAEREGAVPELPSGWWARIKGRY